MPFCLALLFVGCASNILYERGGLTVGSRIQLHQPLTIPPGRTRLFLQRGQVLAGRPGEYHPHCNFEIRTLAQAPRTIAPDEFLVTRLEWGSHEVVMHEFPKLAALGISSLGSYDQAMVARYVHIYLSSERQPDVMRLTCQGAFDFPIDADLPTPAEIVEALGTIATLAGYPRPGVIEP